VRPLEDLLQERGDRTSEPEPATADPAVLRRSASPAGGFALGARIVGSDQTGGTRCPRDGLDGAE
jgi:hypothetical protein